MTRKLLLFVVNDPAFFLSHRLPLAEAARSEGFDVHVATMGGPSCHEIRRMGFNHHAIRLSRSGRNVLQELASFLSIWHLINDLRPDLIHLVTIKPVLYGGIAARYLKVPGVVSAISGLGLMFAEQSSLRWKVLRRLVIFLYRLAMRHPNQIVIFQNLTDLNTIVTEVGISTDKTRLIDGSGVDLRKHEVIPEPKEPPVIVMASRLLKNKGVEEFVEAARILRSRNIDASFRLIGKPDPGNPESVTADTVCAWQNEGIVECMGFRSDIPEQFSRAHVVTLPSYYGEGLPRVLIEAAASGRPVVTTDMPGCRDAIEPDVTGLLVPVRDAQALADAIQRLIEDVDLRQRMGRKGRLLAEKEFSIEKVVKAHLDIYRELVASA